MTLKFASRQKHLGLFLNNQINYWIYSYKIIYWSNIKWNIIISNKSKYFHSSMLRLKRSEFMKYEVHRTLGVDKIQKSMSGTMPILASKIWSQNNFYTVFQKNRSGSFYIIICFYVSIFLIFYEHAISAFKLSIALQSDVNSTRRNIKYERKNIHKACVP